MELVETITFTNPINGQPVIITKQQTVSGEVSTLLALLKSLGIKEQVSGTWSFQVNPAPLAPASVVSEVPVA